MRDRSHTFEEPSKLPQEKIRFRNQATLHSPSHSTYATFIFIISFLSSQLFLSPRSSNRTQCMRDLVFASSQRESNFLSLTLSTCGWYVHRGMPVLLEVIVRLHLPDVRVRTGVIDRCGVHAHVCVRGFQPAVAARIAACSSPSPP